MNRPWLIWIVLGSCALLIAGAMAWSTRKAIQLEGQQALAESSVQLEERIRLSLSRMDTAASGLLILENQRPLHHLQKTVLYHVKMHQIEFPRKDRRVLNFSLFLIS